MNILNKIKINYLFFIFLVGFVVFSTFIFPKIWNSNFSLGVGSFVEASNGGGFGNGGGSGLSCPLSCHVNHPCYGIPCVATGGGVCTKVGYTCGSTWDNQLYCSSIACQASCPSGWSSSLPSSGCYESKTCDCVCCSNAITCYKPEACCVPKTTCASDECGSHSDGCGGTINCGGCPSPSAWSDCSSSGVMSRTIYNCSGGICVSTKENAPCTPPCVPKTTCASYECEYQDDGCGGTINCGGCSGSGWYNDGGSYKGCKGEQYCSIQDEVYRSYYCSGGSCTYNITSTSTSYTNCLYVGGLCGYSTNNPPTASGLTTQQGDYCTFDYPQVILFWTFSDPDTGDTQAAYQVQVDDNSNFSSPEINPGKTSSISKSFSPESGQLSYNKTYYWRVMVWDNNDASSNWANGSFTIPAHAYPRPSFDFSSEDISVGKPITLIDQSKCYDSNGTEYDCKEGQNVEYAWYFDYNNSPSIISSTDKGDVEVTFDDERDYKVVLRVTDNSLGEACFYSKETSVVSRLPLPTYQESSPITWLKKIFAKISSLFTRN